MSPSADAAPLPQTPAAPASPPMFGANATKKKAGGGTPNAFNASALGALATATAQKSLLGQ